MRRTRLFLACLLVLLSCLCFINGVSTNGGGSSSVASSSGSLTILFEGDSITSAGRPKPKPQQQGRVALHNALGQSYVYLTAARLTRYVPTANISFINYAVGGSKVADMADRLKVMLPRHQPDVLSVLIGINDIWPTITDKNKVFSADDFQRRYESCLGDIRKSFPKTIIMLGLPFVFNITSVGSWAQWQLKLYAMHTIIRQLAAQYGGIHVVDYWAFIRREFDAHIDILKREKRDHIEIYEPVIWKSWSADGVHPTAAGQHLMAEAWMETFLEQIVPKLKDDIATTIRKSRLSAPYSFDISAGNGMMPAFHVRSPMMTATAAICYDGDSITDGYRDRHRHWRNNDFSNAIGQGFPLILTGYILGQYPADMGRYSVYNYGVNGDVLNYIEQRWVRTLHMKPWIVHLLVGINDIREAMIASYSQNDAAAVDNKCPLDLAVFESILGGLLRGAKYSNPSGTVIVGIPFAFPGPMTLGYGLRTGGVSDAEKQKLWPVWVKCLGETKQIMKKLADRHGFPVIDYPSVFDKIMAETGTPPSVWVVDGIHPTPAGHHLMAETMLRTITSIYEQDMKKT
jgi:lysophospholipase L1-like esterase